MIIMSLKNILKLSGLFGFLIILSQAVSAQIPPFREVDLLAARPDVDEKRLGFVGFSFGATLGGILAGVERGIKAYALMGTAGTN